MQIFFSPNLTVSAYIQYDVYCQKKTVRIVAVFCDRKNCHAKKQRS